MPSNRLNHTHTWKKHPTRRGIYICDHPKCLYNQEKAVLVGKECACNSCGAHFVLTREDLRRARPICLACSNTKKGRAFRMARDLTNRVLPQDELNYLKAHPGGQHSINEGIDFDIDDVAENREDLEDEPRENE